MSGKDRLHSPTFQLERRRDSGIIAATSVEDLKLLSSDMLVRTHAGW